MMAISVVMKLQAPKSSRLQLGVGSVTHSTIYSHRCMINGCLDIISRTNDKAVAFLSFALLSFPFLSFPN